MIFGLDPGVAGCGVAAVRGRELVAAAYVKNPLPSSADDLARCVAVGRASAEWFRRIAGTFPDTNPHRLVCEWPRVYKAGKAKRGADPNDLLLLTAVDGACAVALGCDCEKVEPREWKGNLGENDEGEYLVEKRLVGSEGFPGELSVVERARVVLPSAESLGHNVWDGVGVALHAAGRSLVKPERVIAR
jgi:hypothetical protein